MPALSKPLRRIQALLQSLLDDLFRQIAADEDDFGAALFALAPIALEVAVEAEQIVRKVRGNGTPVWYVLAEDEGHGFTKKSNVDYLFAAQTLFLDRYLQRRN